MHMIEKVTARTFRCDKEHHLLRVKNDIRLPVEDRRVAAPRVSSPPSVARGRGSMETSPCLLFRKFSACPLGYANPNTPPR
jgi:hypothetical protein